MANPSSTTPLANPISIISPDFCAPNPIDLVIAKTFFRGNLEVTDINGNIAFKVKGPFLTSHQVLIDAVGNPIVTLKRKFMSVHDRWQVFRGDSTDSRDLIFSVKLSSIFQLKTKFDVFLANNTKEDVCDFNVKARDFEISCVIYAGESSTIVAQMEKQKKHTVKSALFEKDKFILTVHPNMDYAFIVALIVILDGMNSTSVNSAATVPTVIT
ncbi:hypothetical protein REPUB_Repub15cG0141400 [Reevesia pubescens]